MNQELNSVSNPTKNHLSIIQKFEHQYLPKDQVNYFYQRKLYLVGIKRYMWFFQPEYLSTIQSLPLFSLNRQIKLMRVMEVEHPTSFSFMNKSDELIIHNCQNIEIWKLDKYSVLKYDKTIEVFHTGSEDSEEISCDDACFPVEFDYYQRHWLNDNDDLLVVIFQQKKIKFLSKTEDNNWICQTKRKHWDEIESVEFNQLGNLIIVNAKLNSKPTIVLFHKDPNNGKWKKIYHINTQQYCPATFINNYTFAYIQYYQPKLTFWKLSPFSKRLYLFQSIELQNSDKEGSGVIEYSKSKDILLCNYQGKIYILKQNEKQYEIDKQYPIEINRISRIYRNSGEPFVTNHERKKITLQKI